MAPASCVNARRSQSFEKHPRDPVTRVRGEESLRSDRARVGPDPRMHQWSL